MSQAPVLSALFRSSKKKEQLLEAQKLPPEWYYNESKSAWESSNGSQVKLGPISMLSLSPLEQELLRCLAIYRLQHYGCEISKNVMKASRKQTIEYRSSAHFETDTPPDFSVLPLIDIGPNAGTRTGFSDLLGTMSDSDVRNKKETSRHSSPRKSSPLLDPFSLSTYGDIDQEIVDMPKQEPFSKAEVKQLVHRCCSFISRNGLSTEGIFRIPASKKRITELREKIRQEGFDIASEGVSVHDIAGFLKDILRSMSEPILSPELFDCFMATTKLFHREQIRAIQLMICMIPFEEKEILFELLPLLNRIHTCSIPTIDKNSGSFMAGNKMDAKNLAIVFSPNLMRRTRHNVGHSRSQSLAEVDAATEVVQLMIEHYETLLKVSTRMHNEIVKLLSNLRKEHLSAIMANKINKNVGITSCRLSSFDKMSIEEINYGTVLDHQHGDLLGSYDLRTFSLLESAPFKPSSHTSRNQIYSIDGVPINRSMRKPSQPNKLRRYTNLFSHFSLASISPTLRFFF
ncbi:hypothetical protein ACOME3_007626 [Neoechinorhynchus agilis]